MSEVPVALRARRAVQPDLWPLDRPPPPQVDDPGPRTVLRDGGDTDEVIAAARTAITAAPARWTGAVPDVAADRWHAAGSAVAELASAAVPARVQVRGDGAVHLPELQLTVTGQGRVTGGTGGTGPSGEVADRLLQVPVAERVLHAVALAVAEDLVLIDADGRVVWLHVTAPSGWDPGASVGAPLAALHGPIPDAQRLRAASLALARAVTGGGPFVRWTWGVTATASLPSVPDAPAATPLPDDVGAWTFRAERQTTAPLPTAQLGLFTIRVHRAPLREVISTPRRVRDLADTVVAMTSEMAAYKGIGEERPRLERWLTARR